MGRYANATLKLEFDDLSMPDDAIYVTIRNPKTVPLDQLTPSDLSNDATDDEKKAGTFGIIAGLILDWHVYDATTDEDSPALALPATAASVRLLPLEIQQTLIDNISEVVSTPR